MVLVIVDTLRADRIGCSGQPRTLTPTFDRLARRGIQFQNAISQVPVTAPSIATVLTGAHPQSHGVRDNGFFALGDSAATLAERLRGAGFETAAFVSAAVLEKRYGLDRGFDLYVDDLSEPFRFFRADLKPTESGHQRVERRGERTTELALEWIRARDEGPFFLAVHYFDPHDPYDAPPQYLRPPMQTHYDAEIAYTDACVGALLDGLEREGVLDESLVVLTADHGEGLGEHGEVTHGFFVYDATVRVPLLLSGAGVPPAGRSIAEQARLVDLAPTILDIVALDPDPAFQGRSLASTWSGGGEPERTAYVENYRTTFSYQWSELVGLRSRSWKLVRAPRPELYDLRSDPSETNNLFATRRSVADSLGRMLDDLLAATTTSEPAASSLPLDDEARAKLEALGYVATGAGGERPDDLPDPKDGVAEFLNRQKAKNQVVHASTLAQRGRVPEAKAALAKAIELSSDLAVAHHTLGMVLLQENDLTAARLSFERAAGLDAGSAETWMALGLIAFRQRDDASSVSHFEKAYEVRPEPWARANVLSAHLRSEDWSGALAFLARVRETDRRDPWPVYSRLFVYATASRADDEAALLEELPARDATVRFRRGDLEVFQAAPEGYRALRTGDFSGAIRHLESAVARDGARSLSIALALAHVESGGDLARARDLLDAARSEDPIEEGRRLIVLGRSQLVLDRDARASSQTLARAANALVEVHEPFLATLRFYQGASAAAIGDAASAAGFYSRALEHAYGEFWEAGARSGGGMRLLDR